MAKKRLLTPKREIQPGDDLTPAQRAFAEIYLTNGFNARRAYMAAHPGVKESTGGVEGHRYLHNPKVRVFLNVRLEEAWKPYQMGGEQALGRIGVMAMAATDPRVRLAALRTILEQTGKLKSIPDSIDALAAALRADLEAHKGA